MSLTRYHSKRNFSQTTEPRGPTSRARKSAPPSSRILFVIQKHAATRLHYDFRLEIDGVLKSWAVPKGVPLQKGEKRLAMQVEDHPVEYGGFEGTIPAGNYGAGTVMLWDAGIGELIEGTPLRALQKGKLELYLQGQKLKGHWTLVRMRPKEDGEANAWLLIKTGEDADPVSSRADDRSVLSGRTMKQITAAPNRTWQSNRSQRAKRASRPIKRTVRPSRRAVRSRKA
jgi:bifunctional non-homologous end joining protein LigD